jgi:hypothetical protein
MSTAVDRAPVQPGELLPNGRTLIAIRLLGHKQSDWAGDLYAVIALTGHAGDTYAVWTLVHAVDGLEESRCFGGYYTGDFEKAIDDWTKRRAPGDRS